jgi:hypothetical protein
MRLSIGSTVCCSCSTTDSDRRRLDSRLEAEGAEFLVLAYLLIEGIQAIKAYTRFPGYDLIAADPDNGTSCRIQVKSRWAKDYDRGFPLANLNCDFVVLVALDRGFRYYRRKMLIPWTVGVLLSCTFSPSTCSGPFVQQSGGWSKVSLRKVPQADGYLDRWDLIKEQLRHTADHERGLASHAGV